MQRMGMIIGIQPEHIEEYKQLHADCWPAIREGLRQCQIHNYSIWLHEGENLLFGYWEYHGDDFEADMQRMAADPVTQRWWDLCSPCQRPVATRKSGEHWSQMEQVFFQE